MEEKQEENKSSFSLKNLAVYSSIFGALLIFIGVFKLQLYFNHFGVAIVDYLQFSEIITSFLDDLAFIVSFFICLLLYSTIVARLIIFFIKRFKGREINEDALIKKTYTDHAKWRSIILSFLLAISSFLCLFYFQHWIFICIASIFLLQTFWASILKFTDLNKYSERTLFYLMNFIVLAIMIWLLAELEIFRTESHKIDATVYTDSDTCKTTKDVLYLGKTENYIFFYCKKDKHTTVIPSSRIKKMIIHQK